MDIEPTTDTVTLFFFYWSTCYIYLFAGGNRGEMTILRQEQTFENRLFLLKC